MGYSCLFKFRRVDWVEDELEFPDYETTLVYAEVEKLLLSEAHLYTNVDVDEILEFRIIEVGQEKPLQ